MHKILLVEDDPVIRQMIKKMLEQWGFQVVAVEDFMDVLTVFCPRGAAFGTDGYRPALV